jgi:hypothetical protein
LAASAIAEPASGRQSGTRGTRLRRDDHRPVQDGGDPSARSCRGGVRYPGMGGLVQRSAPASPSAISFPPNSRRVIMPKSPVCDGRLTQTKSPPEISDRSKGSAGLRRPWWQYSREGPRIPWPFAPHCCGHVERGAAPALDRPGADNDCESTICSFMIRAEP